MFKMLLCKRATTMHSSRELIKSTKCSVLSNICYVMQPCLVLLYRTPWLRAVLVRLLLVMCFYAGRSLSIEPSTGIPFLQTMTFYTINLSQNLSTKLNDSTSPNRFNMLTIWHTVKPTLVVLSSKLLHNTL